jgi:cytochrome c556
MTLTIRTALLTAAILALSAGHSAAQTPRTGAMMREKLAHAQKILEALTTSNRDLLTVESGALATIAKSPRWADLKTRELGTYTDNFLKAVAELDAAARRNDFDAAAAQYTAMTTSCYQCHRRLKDLRVAVKRP